MSFDPSKSGRWPAVKSQKRKDLELCVAIVLVLAFVVFLVLMSQR